MFARVSQSCHCCSLAHEGKNVESTSKTSAVNAKQRKMMRIVIDLEEEMLLHGSQCAAAVVSART